MIFSINVSHAIVGAYFRALVEYKFVAYPRWNISQCNLSGSSHLDLLIPESPSSEAVHRMLHLQDLGLGKL